MRQIFCCFWLQCRSSPTVGDELRCGGARNLVWIFKKTWREWIRESLISLWFLWAWLSWALISFSFLTTRFLSIPLWPILFSFFICLKSFRSFFVIYYFYLFHFQLFFNQLLIYFLQFILLNINIFYFILLFIYLFWPFFPL